MRLVLLRKIASGLHTDRYDVAAALVVVALMLTIILACMGHPN